MAINVLTTADFEAGGLDKARRIFEGKAARRSDAFEKLTREQRALAFRVAKINEGRILQRARTLVKKTIDGEISYRDLRDAMIKLLGEEDLPGSLLNRISIVYRQNALSSYSIARRQTLEDPFVKKEFPYWQYMTVGDGTPGHGGVRESHAALHGKVFRADDPIWDTIYPPWDWGCRCFVIPLQPDDVDGKMKVTDGETIDATPAETIASPSVLFDPESFDLQDMDADLVKAIDRMTQANAENRKPKRRNGKGTEPMHDGVIKIDCRGSFGEIGKAAPSRVLIVQEGKIASSRGEFIVDAAGAAMAVAEFKKKGNDLIWDLEHQSLGGEFATADGVADAIAWIHDLEYVPGEGLWAHVHQWDDEWANRIVAKRYKYFSPTVLVRTSDRKMIGLDSVGMTHRPAIPHSPVLVNKDGEQSMDFIKELAAALGMSADDPNAVMQAALAKLKGGGDEPAEEVPNSVIKALTLKDGAKPEEVVAEIEKIKNAATAKPDEGDVLALRDKLTALQGQVDADKKRRQVEDAVRIVNAEKHKGKMFPAEIAQKVKRIQAASNFDAAVKDFEDEMDVRPVVLKQDRLPAWDGNSGGVPADRQMIVNSATKSYREARETSTVTCSLRDWVNLDLREAGQGKLSDDEAGKLVAA